MGGGGNVNVKVEETDGLKWLNDEYICMFNMFIFIFIDIFLV